MSTTSQQHLITHWVKTNIRVALYPTLRQYHNTTIPHIEYVTLSQQRRILYHDIMPNVEYDPVSQQHHITHLFLYFSGNSGLISSCELK